MLQFDLIADNEKSYIFEGTFSKFIGKLKAVVIVGNSVEALPNNPLKHFVYGVG